MSRAISACAASSLWTLINCGVRIRSLCDALLLDVAARVAGGERDPDKITQYSDNRNGWEVSWLPGQIMDRNTAVTAMTLADAAGHDLHERHRLWPHIQSWAGELGLSAPKAISMVLQPPCDINRQQEPASQQADPEAAD